MSLARWASAFVFTQVVEVPVYRRVLGASLLRSAGASAITHPLVWWVAVESSWSASWSVRTASGELFAFAVEALYFGVAFGARRGALASLVANGASFTLGLVAYALVGALW